MGSHWQYMYAKSLLFSLAVLCGGRTSPVIFSSIDCFEWALIDGIDMQRARSFLWQFCMGGRTSAKVCSSAKFELIVSSFALPSQSSFVSY